VRPAESVIDFVENILEQRRSIVGEGVVYSAAGEGVIPFIDSGDIAAARCGSVVRCRPSR
jgi:hypothetical protein